MEKAAKEVRTLTEAERKRLEKFKNTRGRKQPAKIPARLARTSAFAPRRTSLDTDSKFERLYVVPGHSVIRVSGRELGTQHRDTIYAVFRLPHNVVKTRREGASSALPWSKIYETRTTWRDLLVAMKRSAHTNNLMTLMEVFEDIKKVAFTIFEGPQEEVLRALKARDMVALGANGRGGMGSLIDSVEWKGLTLDSEVVVRYGDWSAAMLDRAKLVSLNAEVQFKLKSDHAKTFWPYIDSMNNHFYVDEDTLAALAGRDLWGDKETKTTRGQFRKDCKQAFDDMVRAEGLASWTSEVTGVGRIKKRRYLYQRDPAPVVVAPAVETVPAVVSAAVPAVIEGTPASPLSRGSQIEMAI